MLARDVWQVRKLSRSIKVFTAYIMFGAFRGTSSLSSGLLWYVIFCISCIESDNQEIAIQTFTNEKSEFEEETKEG